MSVNTLILASLWMVYYALHSALATHRIKNFFRKRIPFLAERYRMLYSLFALINFILLFWFHLMVPSPDAFESGTLLKVVGFILIATAGLLGLFTLRKYPLEFWFWREAVDGNQLIIDGPNQYVRHPLYSSILILLLGIILIFPSWKNLGFSVVTFIYILIGCKLEEQKLIKEFGDTYLDYRKRTKMLIPFIL
jgi:protein-S-isoprenylcysteine O-methyltransferase Ste14